MFLLTAQQSRQLDQASEQLGVSTAVLMEHAGRAVADLLAQRTPPEAGPIAVLAGKGNNGGDARVAAKHLQTKGYRVTLLPFESDRKKFSQALDESAWVMDGLLGVGIKGETQGWVAQAIAEVNRRGKKVLAIDIPSGLSADKGIPLGETIRATVTVCLGGVKLGCFVHPGCEFAGEIVTADIGIPPAAYARISFPCQSIEPAFFASFFKKRPAGAHKGTFGHLLVVAGSSDMPGAGFLAAQAALRSGCGLVTYALPAAAYQKFDAAFAEVMTASIPDRSKGIFTAAMIEDVLQQAEKKTAVVLGPGLGRDVQTERFVLELLPRIALPLILDADGLWGAAQNLRVLLERKAPTILTPHFGEMARLLGWQTGEVERAKIQVALEGAALWRSILVLKGFRTLIGLPDGRLFVNPTGNPGMATAGMGDVLAGALGGLLAQGLPAEKGALAGVYLHGLAGDIAAKEIGERGLIASDVARMLPKAFAQ